MSDDLAALPRTFIQWKGTDLCMDFDCECGGGGHYDGFFAYIIKCPDCGAHYEMPTNIPLKKVDGPSTGHSVLEATL